MKILLVDDETEFVSALAERLGMRGYEADWTSTGKEALSMVAEGQYDLAILDLKMPQISGLELQREMAAINPGLRFLFISGHGSVDDICEGLGQKECYVIKPVGIDQLIAKIKTIMPGDEPDKQ